MDTSLDEIGVLAEPGGIELKKDKSHRHGPNDIAPQLLRWVIYRCLYWFIGGSHIVLQNLERPGLFKTGALFSVTSLQAESGGREF